MATVSCKLVLSPQQEVADLLIPRERFYTVYDTDNSRVGFAETEYTYATSN
jgi:hypothetical protein